MLKNSIFIILSLVFLGLSINFLYANEKDYINNVKVNHESENTGYSETTRYYPDKKTTGQIPPDMRLINPNLYAGIRVRTYPPEVEKIVIAYPDGSTLSVIGGSATSIEIYDSEHSQKQIDDMHKAFKILSESIKELYSSITKSLSLN